MWEFGGKTGSEEEAWRHANVLIGVRKDRFQVGLAALVPETFGLLEKERKKCLCAIKIPNIELKLCWNYFL